MSLNKANRKIVWAVNPFEDDLEGLRSAAWAIRVLTKSSPAEILPIFVWSDLPVPETRVPAHRTEASSRAQLGKLTRQGQAIVGKIVTRVKLPGVRHFQAVRSEGFTLRDEARALVEHAKSIGAELIVVSSHGRKGLKRMILGSWAETLSLTSDVPLFYVQPAWRRIASFKEILFPTDFSPESKAAFRKVLDFAEAQGSRILIFHKLGLPAYPTFEFAYAVGLAYEALFDKQKIGAEQEAEKFAKLAKDRGLRAAVIVDRSTRGTVADAVFKRSRKLNAMIALCSQSGPITTLLLGSTTRKLLRQAEQPVWVIHPVPAQVTELKSRNLYEVNNEEVGRDLRLPLSQRE